MCFKQTDRQTDDCNTNSTEADNSFRHQTQQNKRDVIQFQNNLTISTKGTKFKMKANHRSQDICPTFDTCKVQPRLLNSRQTFTKLNITKLNDATWVPLARSVRCMQMLNGREVRNNGGLSMVINCCLVIEHLRPCLGGGRQMSDCPGHQQHHTTVIRTDLLLPLVMVSRFAETLRGSVWVTSQVLQKEGSCLNQLHWTRVSPSGHYMYRTVVTICTAQWSLYVPHSGQYMYRTAVTICTA